MWQRSLYFSTYRSIWLPCSEFLKSNYMYVSGPLVIVEFDGMKKRALICKLYENYGKIINDHFSHYFKHARSIVFKGYGGGQTYQTNKISKYGGGEGKSALWQAITQIFLKIIFP